MYLFYNILEYMHPYIKEFPFMAGNNKITKLMLNYIHLLLNMLQSVISYRKINYLRHYC